MNLKQDYILKIYFEKLKFMENIKETRQRALKLLKKSKLTRTEVKNFGDRVEIFKRNNKDWRENIPVEPRLN